MTIASYLFSLPRALTARFSAGAGGTAFFLGAMRAAEPRSEELLPAKSVDLTVWWRELSIIVRYGKRTCRFSSFTRTSRTVVSTKVSRDRGCLLSQCLFTTPTVVYCLFKDPIVVMLTLLTLITLLKVNVNML